MGALGASWRSWLALGRSESAPIALGALLVALGLLWDALGAVLAVLVALLAALGVLWGALGCSWGALRALLAALGRPWGGLTYDMNM